MILTRGGSRLGISNLKIRAGRGSRVQDLMGELEINFTMSESVIGVKSVKRWWLSGGGLGVPH